MIPAVIEQAPWWAVVLASLGSGTLVGVGNFLANRRIRPAQQRQLEMSAEQAAMSIVESALKVAQDRIGSLETQIRRLTSRIDELRELIRTTSGDRQRIQRQLDLTLAQRAELQQQLVDLSRLIGERRELRYLIPQRQHDAILIVDMDAEGTITYASDGVFSLLGYAPTELIDHAMRVLLPEGERRRHAAFRNAYAKDPHARQMGSGVPLKARRRDGSIIDVDISLHPTGDGRVIALMTRRVADPPVPVNSDREHGPLALPAARAS